MMVELESVFGQFETKDINFFFMKNNCISNILPKRNRLNVYDRE